MCMGWNCLGWRGHRVLVLESANVRGGAEGCTSWGDGRPSGHRVLVLESAAGGYWSAGVYKTVPRSRRGQSVPLHHGEHRNCAPSVDLILLAGSSAAGTGGRWVNKNTQLDKTFFNWNTVEERQWQIINNFQNQIIFILMYQRPGIRVWGFGRPASIWNFLLLKFNMYFHFKSCRNLFSGYNNLIENVYICTIG